MNISIIIPIFNADNYLLDLFNALEKNAFFEGDEILLVDNGSTDDSVKKCMNQVNKYPNLYRLLIYTEKAGSYAARNYGVKNAKGDILLFTDSDTKPISTWVESVRKNIKKNVVMAGRIKLEVQTKCLWEQYDNLVHLNSEKSVIKNQVATANMAVMLKDFLKVGFFEERFSGGDFEWSMRAKDTGLRIRYNKNAMVFHPTRKTFDQIIKKEQRIAYGVGNHYRIHKKNIIILILIYVAKIFKVDTNIRLHNALRKCGVTGRELREFDKKFWKVRIEQLKYSIYGFKMIDPRLLNVK